MSATLKFGTDGQWATKVGSTLAYNDENGNFKPLPFNFTRSTSATRVNKDGLIEVVTNNKPRIDFLNDSNGALLLEPQRINLVTYSEDFSQGAWVKTNTTVSSNQVISPDGTLNADKLIATAVSGFHSMSQTIGSKIALTPYTFSFFAKADEIGFCVPNISTAFSGTQLAALINLSDGTASGVSAGLSVSTEDYGNGWYRIKLTATSQNNTSSFLVTINATNASGVLNFTGDGTSGILLYGAQLEQGSYATSYIPTQGATATRVAETCNQTPPSGIIGQTEGTMFLDFNIDDISLQTQDPVLMYLKNSSGITSYFEMYDNGSFVVVHINSGSIALTKNGLTDGRHKAAFAYKDNDFAFYVDGTLAGTNTSFTVASSQTEVGLQFTTPLYTGKQLVNDMKLYNTRLSNAELQELTTI